MTSANVTSKQSVDDRPAIAMTSFSGTSINPMRLGANAERENSACWAENNSVDRSNLAPTIVD